MTAKYTFACLSALVTASTATSLWMMGKPKNLEALIHIRAPDMSVLPESVPAGPCEVGPGALPERPNPNYDGGVNDMGDAELGAWFAAKVILTLKKRFRRGGNEHEAADTLPAGESDSEAGPSR